MLEPSFVIFFLGLIGLCAVLITIALLITAYEAHRTLGTARQLLARTDKAAARVEGMIHKSCGMAEGLLEQITLVKERAYAFWTRQFGNGTQLRSRNGQRK